MEHLWVIFVLGPIATFAISYTPLGRALIERVRGRAGLADALLLDVQDEIERLREQMAEQDHRFEELHDRLDFAERLLVRGPVPNEPEEAVTPV
jgi:hypothetical protein